MERHGGFLVEAPRLAYQLEGNGCSEGGRMDCGCSSIIWQLIGSGNGAWQNALDILIRCRLEPSVGRPGSIVLSKHISHRIGIDLQSLGEETIRLLHVADGLLMQASLG
jgi:hypothetical protein